VKSDNTIQSSFLIENLMYAATVCVAQGKVADAILLYGKIIEQKPDYANAYFERGRLLHKVGELREAAEDLRRAFQLSPELEKEITGQFHAGTSSCR
jgi:tetratricopeptide (TPR) repeat protein